MTEKQFDIPSFLLGIIICFLSICFIVWAYEYGYGFFNYYKEFIGGFVIGFAIMWAIHTIDWEVGF